VTTRHEAENGRPTIVTRAGQHWLFHWHRFLDFLAEGKTREEFFATIKLSNSASCTGSFIA
jgi:hypothetical protein